MNENAWKDKTTMAVDRDSIVVGISPRISPHTFALALVDASSPAAPDAFAMYNAVEANGIDPAFFLAIFKGESQYGTDPASIVVKYETRNPGNCRSSSIGRLPVVDTERGQFVRYSNWAQGADDATHRLTDARFPYAKAGARTISAVLPIWSPSAENSTEIYIANVVTIMNRLIEQEAIYEQAQAQAQAQLKGKAAVVSMFDLNNIPFKQSPNFTPGGNSCKRIVIHSTEGSYSASVGWLLNQAAQASAHYVINEDGSECTQLVKDTDVAWHTGNWAYNTSCIGIEHSWYSDGRNGPPPDSLYQAGASLAAKLCHAHGITPVRGQTIIAHGEVPPPNDHTDPGPRWDWSKFMDYLWTAYNIGRGSASISTSGGTIKVFEPNPKGFKVGQGVLETLTREGMTALTDEQYYVPDANKPGLAKRSFTYADRAGVTYRVEALQDLDANDQPLQTWKTQVWQFVH